jgi:deoxyribonuclease I
MGGRGFRVLLAVSALLVLGTCHAEIHRTLVIPAPAAQPDLQSARHFDTPDGLPTPPHSFESAKKAAMRIYADNRVTFYCGCRFDEHKNVDAASCGYVARKNAARGARVEWEHIVPAHAFGHFRPCWYEPRCTQNGRTHAGRTCCRQIDPDFRRMEADLQNLVPAVGELNGDRSNFEYGEIPGEARVYGACDFEVDVTERLAEPAESLRGDIARTYLYMHEAYPGGLPLRKDERKRFEAWSRKDPPTPFERTRNQRISALQGGGNWFVD